jgi:phage recombination protein Bet
MNNTKTLTPTPTQIAKAEVIQPDDFFEKSKHQFVFDYISGRLGKHEHNTPKKEIENFIIECSVNKLNPLKGEIFPLPFWDSKKNHCTLTAHISHKGLLVRAHRTNQCTGVNSKPIFDRKNNIIAAKAYCSRAGHKFFHTVYFKEYYKKDGLWKTYPIGLLCKCAEAGAIRKAFPDETGHLYIKEELEKAQADSFNEQVTTAPKTYADVKTGTPTVKERHQMTKIDPIKWNKLVEKSKEVYDLALANGIDLKKDETLLLLADSFKLEYSKKDDYKKAETELLKLSNKLTEIIKQNKQQKQTEKPKEHKKPKVIDKDTVQFEYQLLVSDLEDRGEFIFEKYKELDEKYNKTIETDFLMALKHLEEMQRLEGYNV